jgi:molecular chaperone DnaK (HSP70)
MAMQRLKEASEKAKIELSASLQVKTATVLHKVFGRDVCNVIFLNF